MLSMVLIATVVISLDVPTVQVYLYAHIFCCSFNQILSLFNKSPHDFHAVQKKQQSQVGIKQGVLS